MSARRKNTTDWQEEIYICPECGKRMTRLIEPSCDELVCESCGCSFDTERYGMTDEEYEALYPSEEEVLGYVLLDDSDKEDTGETYDEVCGELDD